MQKITEIVKGITIATIMTSLFRILIDVSDKIIIIELLSNVINLTSFIIWCLITVLASNVKNKPIIYAWLFTTSYLLLSFLKQPITCVCISYVDLFIVNIILYLIYFNIKKI